MEPRERLKMVRNTLGETQEVMAKAMRIKRSAYNQIETGKNSLRPDRALWLKYVYKVDPDWIMTGAGEMFLPPGTQVSAPELQSGTAVAKEQERRMIELEAEIIKAKEDIERYKMLVDILAKQLK